MVTSQTEIDAVHDVLHKVKPVNGLMIFVTTNHVLKHVAKLKPEIFPNSAWLGY